MPVTSPRRSSLLASGGSNFTTSTSPQSSITATVDRSNTYKSYLDRSNNLSKYSGSTSNSPSSLYYNYSPSNYLGTNSSTYNYSSYSPRTYSTYRSLSGGSTGIGTYRNTNLTSSPSHLNYDSNSSSRCGFGTSVTPSTSATTTTTTTDQWRNSQINSNTNNSSRYDQDGGLAINDGKPPSGSQLKRTSRTAHGSAAALARLVATSALDIYEKYSPANYKPNTDLSGSRSSALNEDKTNTSSIAATDINDTFEGRCKSTRSSRYGRWYSQQSTDEVDNGGTPTVTMSATATFYPRVQSNSRTRSLGILNNNTNDTNDYTYHHDNDAVTSATITLRSTRLDKSKKFYENNNIDNNVDYDRNDTGDTINNINSFDKIDSANSSPILNRYKTRSFNSNLNDERSGGDIQWNYHGRTNSGSGGRDNTNSNGDELKIRGNALSTAATIPSSVASPTSSRYWDRDRSSSILHNSNSITGYSNHLDDGKKSTKIEETAGLCGLRNIGNTCFMNSVIQCLSHTDELTKFLRSYNAARSPTSKDQQILYEFSKLIKEMWTANVNCVTPLELKRAFSAKHRMYSDYNQQDAQEFLRFFLDSLHSALNTGVKGEHLHIDDNLNDNRKADLTWEWYCRHENSVIRDLFVGQLKSTLRCTTCGNASVTFDPFWDLSVPLPSSSRCKLEACLDLFIREEVLDGDEMPTCSKCQTRRKCTKSFTIQRFPKYLVIHLKRFSETRWSKLSNIVEFPTGVRELNMAPYAANGNSNITYSLYAISNHMGSTAGGHYVAICKHPISQKWHEFNDNIVSDALSEHHLVSSSAYILFYERA